MGIKGFRSKNDITITLVAQVELLFSKIHNKRGKTG